MRPILLGVALLAHAATAEELKLSYLTQDQLKTWVSQAEAKNTGRLDRLRSLFQSVGCATTEQKVSGSKMPNLICEIPGPDEAVILIGAHYDKVDQSQGVIDNWSGASMLPAIYQAIKYAGTAAKHMIVFVAFADEEKGLVGSRSYAAKLKKEERAHYEAMINIDSVGSGPVKIWAGRNDPRLTQLLNAVAVSLKIEVGAINLDQVGLGDSFPFHDKKIRTIDFHSLTAETWPILHSPRDNPQALQFENYWDTYRLVATYVAYLDLKLTPAPAKKRHAVPGPDTGTRD